MSIPRPWLATLASHVPDTRPLAWPACRWKRVPWPSQCFASLVHRRQARQGGNSLHKTTYYRIMALVSGVLTWGMLFASAPGSALERYVFSPQKSHMQFQAYSFLAKPMGTFHTLSVGIITDAQHLSRSHVRLVIDATSIDTANAKRDKHLRSEDFLFVEKYPTITFVSTAITKNGRDYMVQGDLRIRGVTKSIRFPVTVEQRQEEIIVRGSIRLYRKDFGMHYNAFFNPVKNAVDVTFTIVGVNP